MVNINPTNSLKIVKLRSYKIKQFKNDNLQANVKQLKSMISYL